MKLSLKASLIFLGMLFFVLAGWTSQSKASFINFSGGTLTIDLGKLEIIINNHGFQLDLPNGDVVINSDGLQFDSPHGGIAIDQDGVHRLADPISNPLPPSVLLLGSGLLGLGLLGWRRKRS